MRMKQKWIEFLIFKLKIGEIWFGEYGDIVNSELLLTKFAGIDFHENAVDWRKGHGCVST